MKGWIDVTLLRSGKKISNKVNINNIASIQDITDLPNTDGNKTSIFFIAGISPHFLILSVTESYAEVVDKIKEAI
jgi:hypothetical protein